ncbi:hypothetical protein THO17_02290 [Marinomonas sp. THO17]
MLVNSNAALIERVLLAVGCACADTLIKPLNNPNKTINSLVTDLIPIQPKKKGYDITYFMRITLI